MPRVRWVDQACAVFWGKPSSFGVVWFMLACSVFHVLPTIHDHEHASEAPYDRSAVYPMGLDVRCFHVVAVIAAAMGVYPTLLCVELQAV